MTTPTNNAVLSSIRGAELKRFVVHAALLCLIDPVRGEPTRTAVDEDPDGINSGGQRLKKNFLDSFALICSTSASGAETASAVCLEQHAAAGAVLRVARNRGLTPPVLNGLEGVLQLLRVVSKKEKSSTQAELDILRLVVELDRDRILSMAEKVEKRGIRNSIRKAHSKLLAGQVELEAGVNPELKTWLEICPFTAASLQTWSSKTLAILVDWASQARWLYSEHLRALLGFDHTQQPPWLDSLYKIARYRYAIRAMVKLAAKQPEVFAAIHIQEVKAPDLHPFSLSKEKNALLTALKTLLKEDSGIVMEQLEKHLGTGNVEEALRRKCHQTLTLHAEMQLTVFYEGNPSSTPQMRFIGTSKKACFLCHEYLLRHPLGLQALACHQKIYPSWMPPPYYPVNGRFKSSTFVKLSKSIEQLTKRELKTSLTAPRRPKNQDSTAGPSLTLTAVVPMGLTAGQSVHMQFAHRGSSRPDYLEWRANAQL